MNHYNHLTPKEREIIMISYENNISMRNIARILKRQPSTISRELKRNKENGIYSAYDSQNKYIARRSSCKPKKKLANKELFDLIKDLFVNHQWSPEEIANRLKHEHSKFSISYNTIYRGIYDRSFDPPGLSHGNKGMIRKLRHRGKSRHTSNYVEKRGKIQISNEICARPKEANDRTRIGDWEGDTVAGVAGKSCLVTMVDRKSRFLLCERIAKKTAQNVNDAILKMFTKNPVKTITPDRGKEFSRHKEITDILNVEFYFPLPHHPWQRGTNENTNGLLREYFPKSTDITDLEDTYIQEKVNEINLRPRKCLGWKTPYEVFYDKVLHLV